MTEERSPRSSVAVRHVRWFWPDDGTWAYDELDADGWTLRHIEIRADDERTVVAGSLAEVKAARDHGGAAGVVAYESRYGVVPEGQVPHDAEGWDLTIVSADEFERRWAVGRAEMEAVAE